MKRLLALVVFAASLLAAQAFADCVSPTAVAGATAYAANVATMVYCDGNGWVSMAGGVSATIGGTTYTNTPGGSTNSVQYNNGSGFGGDTFFTYSGGLLTISNISATGSIAASGNVTAAAFYGDGSHLTGISTQGDRIVSGTLSAIVNGASGYISLTTGATNWGYLSGGQSFIPVISTTNTGVSNVLGFTGQSVTTVAGGGGNYIVSGSASVSTSQANGGTIKMGTSSGPVLTISGSNVGIGTSNPLAGFDFAAGLSGSFSRLRIEPSGAAYGARLNWYGSNGVFANVARIDGVVINGGDGNEAAELAFSTMANGSLAERMRISAGGNVGIDTSSPGAPLDITGGNTGTSQSGAGGLVLRALDGLTRTVVTIRGGVDGVAIPTDAVLNVGGGATLTYSIDANHGINAAGGYTQNSDRRLKTNIQPLPEANGLTAIEALKPVTYNWIDPLQPQTTQMGFIAQDVQKIFPGLVIKGGPTKLTPDGRLSLNYIGLVTPLVKAVQELKAQNDDLRTQLQKMQRQIDELKTERR